MKFSYLIMLLLLLVTRTSRAADDTNITICSWNLMDFGKSRSDPELEFIAQTVNPYDIVMIQEVVAGDPGGARAVARLAAALNRKGSKWEYRISEITSGENSYKKERYAFLWKPSTVKLIGKPWLEMKYHSEIDREPFFATFRDGIREFTLVNFHAITKTRQPETEVRYFRFLPPEYPSLNLIFCGDFNLPQSHTVFNPLKKMGYQPALTGQKTSLKISCHEEDCLASEFDNVFYNPAKLMRLSSGVVHFYRSFSNLAAARKISDHLPVFFVFRLV